MRLLGAAAVFLGLLVVGVDIPTVDPHVVSLPVRGNHGIVVSDLIGSACVVAGVALLWRASSGGET